MSQSLFLSRRINGALFELCRGDITNQNVDAIVNAANSRLCGGGGVDGAIHAAGGPTILEECRKLGGCPVGQAVVTGAGDLQARIVIHTVGPVWAGEGGNEAELLRSAYTQSLRQAVEHMARSVAFPAISTGAYGYPLRAAAEVAVEAVVDFLNRSNALELVRLVLFTPSDCEVYDKVARRLIDGPLFGCYWNFSQAPERYYATLLHLNSSSRLDSALFQLLELRRRPEWEEDSLKMLSSRDWRMHLPPAVTMFLTGERSPALLRSLWKAVRRGSWVSPQLLCVLLALDSGFPSNLDVLVESGLHRETSGDGIRDHVEMGPGTNFTRLGKIAAAALGLSEAGLWNPPPALEERLRELAPHDYDDAGTIAVRWQAEIETLHERNS